ncbi:hypothetical protein [Phreatobacter stygius]|uniref:Uncharacterized protein n=1 Tax=Phreatobacter stygius TaxID=1940610 RepID=A0A4D7B2D0_9HYPH|nr:hypothetical protein [Phreatobacter stygius]QCI67724.1 hypothetical protein E8M01_27980 [Phreatobacter stygius]
MSGLAALFRHGRPWAGHPRMTFTAEDVDGRDKHGHDAWKTGAGDGSSMVPLWNHRGAAVGVATLFRHGRPWVGHPRMAFTTEDVDGRDKHGHDAARAINGQIFWRCKTDRLSCLMAVLAWPPEETRDGGTAQA